MRKIIIIILFFISQILCAQEELIIDGNPCGQNGSAKVGSREYNLNPLKNRYNIPNTNDFDTKITFETLLSWKVTVDSSNQGKAVEITGYVLKVKPTNPESCNCGADNPQFMDTHIELTPNAQETTKDKIVVVEVTPRIRQMLLKNGIDYSTDALKKKIEGHMVKIQGWLLCDLIHKANSFVDNPSGKSIWRGTTWEIHPITKIDVLDEGEESGNYLPFVDDGGTKYNPPQPPVNEPTLTTKPNTNMETPQTPLNTLVIILVGAILGAVGQGIRVMVGLKKVYDQALSDGKPANDLLQYKQLALSLFIGFGVGAIAGVLASVMSINIQFSKSVIIGFITAGYAGTDFIEGFMKKNPTITQDSTKG